MSNIDSNESSNSNGGNNYRLIFGDFMEIAKKEIQDNSINLILTDPPDRFEALGIYEGIAWLADRVLKPGSSLVFSCRSSNSGEVMRLFDDNNDNLKYWSIFSGKYSGNHYKVDRRHVYAEWNPMLWYVKR